MSQTGAPRPSWVPHDLYPFTSRFADVDAARVHYVDEGDGPAMLLLHGNPTWSFLYRESVLGTTSRRTRRSRSSRRSATGRRRRRSGRRLR